MPAPFDPEKLSILVVDSSMHHRNLLAALLRGHGVTRLRLAESAVEAHDLIRRGAPGIVLTEWEAEGVDGLALCREVRLSDDAPDRTIPFVVVTSRASRADVEAARNAGVNEYVIKPVSAQSVLTRLQEVVLRPRAFIESPTYVGPCRRRRALASYAGPFRRMNDPIEEAAADPQEDRKKELARKAIAALAEAGRALVVGDRVGVRRLYQAAQGVASCGVEIGDQALERAAQSLLRYLDGLGASPLLERRVIDTHVDAMTQIVALPNAARDLRDRVVSGLQVMVTKKLRGEAGAADINEAVSKLFPDEQGSIHGISR